MGVIGDVLRDKHKIEQREVVYQLIERVLFCFADGSVRTNKITLLQLLQFVSQFAAYVRLKSAAKLHIISQMCKKKVRFGTK